MQPTRCFDCGHFCTEIAGLGAYGLFDGDSPRSGLLNSSRLLRQFRESMTSYPMSVEKPPFVCEKAARAEESELDLRLSLKTKGRANACLDRTLPNRMV